MRPKSQDMNNPPNRALLDQLTGEHRAFNVQTFAVVNHVFPARLSRNPPGFLQLTELSKRGLIGKVMFASSHDPCAERPSFRGDSGRCHKMNSRILEDLVEGPGNFRLWKCCSKALNQLRIGIENPA